jgi:hypothetical protein
MLAVVRRRSLSLSGPPGRMGVVVGGGELASGGERPEFAEVGGVGCLSLFAVGRTDPWVVESVRH